jgi:N utilization substance protein B
MMMIDKNDLFPLSVTKEFYGTRRLAREKVVQLIYAHFLAGVSVDEIFPNVYNRVFNFGDEEQEKLVKNKILRPSEVIELEADVPVKWKLKEISFIQDLIKSILQNRDYVDSVLKKTIDNWEVERVATVDRAIIHMATNEFLFFNDIPIKVTINEALDIAKDYSTDRSHSFINGVLDTLSNILKEEKKINKEGKGLIDK